MIDTTFLNQLRKFHLIINKRVTSNYAGTRKSIAHGRGISLLDFRNYVAGDDFRTIDWRIYARTDKLHVRRYEEERNLTAHIIVDYSASMNFGDKNSKFEYACMLGIGFAYLAMRDNEKFEFSTFADDIHYFTPRRGMHQLASMIEHLQDLKLKGKSRFEESLSKYRKLITTKSVIFIVSDFLFNIEEIKAGLSRMDCKNHEIKVIQVLDRKEAEIDIEGDVKLRDAESNDVLHTNISPRLRKKYQMCLNEHSAKIEDLCHQMGIDFFFVTSDMPVFDAFYEIMRH
ncbi:DUF58 domain-containing protein [Candidatus Woesearchaeota archaeon]|nr:DUF58 domain-containing protein [Candidatus Woesearchaeota archaeon]